VAEIRAHHQPALGGHGLGGETGRVEDVLRKYADQWNLSGKDTTAYLCGRPEMIENAAGILARRGWDKRAMQSEAYF